MHQNFDSKPACFPQFNILYKYLVFFNLTPSHLIPLPVQILGLEVLLGGEDLWPVLLGLTVVPTVLQMALLPFCPESPRFLYIVRCQEHHAKRGELAWSTPGWS